MKKIAQFEVQKIDKVYNIPYNPKYCKTKQVVGLEPTIKDSLVSKFATGKFSNGRVKS